MDLYKKFQPVTWSMGVIEASPSVVAEIIQPKYVPDDELKPPLKEHRPEELQRLLFTDAALVVLLFQCGCVPEKRDFRELQRLRSAFTGDYIDFSHGVGPFRFFLLAII